MGYAPSTFHAGTGEDFFRKEGFLVDGMDPLISARYTIPAFDDYDGTAVTITNSVAKSAAGSAPSWAGWDLSAAKTKLLVLAYTQPSTSAYAGVGVHKGTLPGTTLEDDYQTNFDTAPGTLIGKHVSGSWTTLGTDATIYQDDAIISPIWGIALYVDADNDIQKSFVKSGTAEWLQVLSTADDSSASGLTSFQSVYLRYAGLNARFIAPIMVWGS